MSVEIYIERQGQGPPLVLLHGWALNLRVFDSVVPLLATNFSVHAIDLPGHGRSAGPLVAQSDFAVSGSRSGERSIDRSGSPALESIAERLLAVLPSHFALCGWSLGGQIAMAIAALAPTRVSSLALVATTPRFTKGETWPHGVSAPVLANMAEMLRRDPGQAVQDMLELQVRGAQHAAQVLGALRRALLSHGAARAEELESGLRLLGSVDLRGDLERIVAPTLVISGQYDRVTLAAAGRWLADHLPHGSYHEFARCGHAPFLSHAEEFADLLRRSLMSGVAA